MKTNHNYMKTKYKILFKILTKPIIVYKNYLKFIIVYKLNFFSFFTCVLHS